MDISLSLIKNRLFKNISWLMAEKLIRMSINFVIFGLLARYLGVSKFGTFSYFLTIVYLLNPFWTLGTNQIIKDKMSKNPNDKEKYIWAGIVIKLSTSLILLGLSTFYILFFDDVFEQSVDKYLFLVLLFSYLFRSVDVFELWFDSQIRSKHSSIVKVFAFLFTSVFYIIGVFLKFSILYFGICFIFEFLLVGFGYLYIYFKRDSNILKFEISGDVIRNILVISLPIFFADISITIFTRINQVMLNHYIDKEAVGIFAAAMRLTEIWLFIAASICITFFAPIVIAGKEKNREFQMLVRRLFNLVNVISCFIIVVVFIFASPIVLVVFGKDYLKSVHILQILIWSNLFVFWSYAQEPWDIAKGMIKFRFFRVSLGACLNIVLNMVLIPSHGCVGAAYSTLISYAVAYFLCNICTKTSREIFIIQLKSFMFWKSGY